MAGGDGTFSGRSQTYVTPSGQQVPFIERAGGGGIATAQQAYNAPRAGAVQAAPAPAPAAAPAPAPAAAAPAAVQGATTPNSGTQIVAGNPSNANEMNVATYAGQLATNPSLALTPAMKLSGQVPNIDENAAGTNIDPNDPKYAMQANALAQQAVQAGQITPAEVATYTAQLTQQLVEQAQMQAAQGTMNQNALINAPQIDMQGTATGINADGSINWTGAALNQYAKQGMEVVDTSTPEGKLRAAELGEGNYTDSQATVKGQLQKLQSDFVGPNGEPKIPAYAAESARNVARMGAFKGMTGTAATAAMSQALHEASITVATQDAQFFQTLTLQNLNNKQAMTINRANVLAKMDQINVDNRMAAAIENAKKFMELDMKNLDNRQQAEVINTQNRVQSILEDAKAVNAQRLFTADAKNDFAKYYDGLNASIDMYNASETNKMSQFNADLENNRQQFYQNMQYNIDAANAKWRQSVTMQEADYAFQAAATDVKNLIGISQEALNRLWDRSDSLLDYAFKASENEKDRAATLAIAKLNLNAADQSGLGSIFGTIAGKGAEALFSNLFDF